MRVAIVGCGYVADQYMATLPFYRDLELVAACDRDATRAERFRDRYGVSSSNSLAALLDDDRIELILNLTNPASHFSVNATAVAAGKHVYSEKPLALTLAEAQQLVSLADRRGVQLSGAPSRVLGEPAQTMWKAIRDGAIGRPRLVYAEMDDGLLHTMDFRAWVGSSGAAWPYLDELTTGCTLEHAGYALTWLAAYFGPARALTAFSTLVVPEKVAELAADRLAPDFSVACLSYDNGVTARLTCSIVAPPDHSFRVVGEEAVLIVDDCWKPDAAVRFERRVKNGRWLYQPEMSSLPMQRDPRLAQEARRLKKVDFCLGPLEMIDAIRDGRRCRLSAEFCCHVTETSLAISSAIGGRAGHRIETTFDPIAPMPWAV